MADEPRASHRPDHQEEPARRISVRVWILVGLVVIVVLLGVDNRDRVELGYLVGETEVRLVWVIIGALVLGGLMERTYAFIRTRDRKRGDD